MNRHTKVTVLIVLAVLACGIAGGVVLGRVMT